MTRTTRTQTSDGPEAVAAALHAVREGLSVIDGRALQSVEAEARRDKDEDSIVHTVRLVYPVERRG